MLAIHARVGSYSDRWLEYCRDHAIHHCVVDARSPDIIHQFRGAAGFLWHWAHWDPVDLLFARHLIQAAEAMGLNVFPNSRTCWHYDDKIAQHYLLDALDAPVVPTWVFYDQTKALEWISRVHFPKVFKLRCGAGSSNVRLVRSRREAERLCHKAFTVGFKPVASYFSDLASRWRRARQTRTFVQKALHAPSALAWIRHSNQGLPRQRGYVYFQDFIPNNTHDTRVTVIGDRAFAFRRAVRPGDFRASGSGSIDWSTDRINLECVQIAFQVARAIGTQSLAFDFVEDALGQPRILEISYAFAAEAVHGCPGWWDSDLRWHYGHVWPQDCILEDLLAACDLHEDRLHH